VLVRRQLALKHGMLYHWIFYGQEAQNLPISAGHLSSTLSRSITINASTLSFLNSLDASATESLTPRVQVFSFRNTDSHPDNTSDPDIEDTPLAHYPPPPSQPSPPPFSSALCGNQPPGGQDPWAHRERKGDASFSSYTGV